MLDPEVVQKKNFKKGNFQIHLHFQFLIFFDKLTKLFIVFEVGCVVQRIQVLKRKAEENIEDELNSSYVCKRKIEHLKGIAPPENNNEIWQASFDKWKRVSKRNYSAFDYKKF